MSSDFKNSVADGIESGLAYIKKEPTGPANLINHKGNHVGFFQPLPVGNLLPTRGMPINGI
ncbi:hypothetical protein GCM10011514_06340 [Emticicia aquatilis]|uniref:Uncharacterized protein n=1 Tax=Emticicia aquatilis TaxID=1537369 RepID=A0A917DKU7_9BACT|nr:hypothetical protein GCM10011514_06340 [Emticicia aquatilis]